MNRKQDPPRSVRRRRVDGHLQRVKRPDAARNGKPSRTFIETGAQSEHLRAVFIEERIPIDKRSKWYGEFKRRYAAALAPYGPGVDPLIARGERAMVYAELILEKSYAKIGRTGSVTSASGDGPSGATMSALAAVREVRGMIAQIREHLKSLGGGRSGVSPEAIQAQRQAVHDFMDQLTPQAQAAVRWALFNREAPPPVEAMPLLALPAPRRRRPVVVRHDEPQHGGTGERGEASSAIEPPEAPNPEPKRNPELGGPGCRVREPREPSAEEYSEWCEADRNWSGGSPW